MTTNARRSATATLLAACVLGLAGCGGSDEPTAAGRAAATPSRFTPGLASPAPSVWPQATNGVIDEKMCAILTSDDFMDVGMMTATPEASAFKPDGGDSGVSCTYSLDDRVIMGLFPSGTAAAKFLKGETGMLRRITGGPVPTADETRFMKGTSDGEYHLVTRRGRLIVWVHLVPSLNRLDQAEALHAATTLNGLVLTRAPKLGR